MSRSHVPDSLESLVAELERDGWSRSRAREEARRRIGGTGPSPDSEQHELAELGSLVQLKDGAT